MSTRLLLFESTRAVIKAEALCREQGIPFRVVPVPRHISSQCGMSLQINETYEAEALSLLRGAGIHVNGHEA